MKYKKKKKKHFNVAFKRVKFMPGRRREPDIKHSELHIRLESRINGISRKINRIVKFVTTVAIGTYAYDKLKKDIPAEKWKKAQEKIKTVFVYYNNKH